jgi:hypothetical protein
VSLESRELYLSSNGDQWLLVRDERGHVFVRHVPNAPSGGKTQDIDIGVFLSRGPPGPEHQALLRLIGSLVPKADEATGSPVG